MVVADTSAWTTYHRDPGSDHGQAMDYLLSRREMVMTGMVLTEVLRGARSHREFVALRDRLTAIQFLNTDQQTWIRVASLALRLRERGEMIPFTDLIVAAVAMQHNEPLYALDEHFQRVPGLRRYPAGSTQSP